MLQADQKSTHFQMDSMDPFILVNGGCGPDGPHPLHVFVAQQKMISQEIHKLLSLEAHACKCKYLLHLM